MYLKLDESKWHKHRYEWSDRSKGIGRVDVYEGQIEVAEDVAPVVHAHWRTKEFGYAILNMNDEVMWLAGVPCSCCSITGQTNWKYCPNCGAKMDEEVKDD